MASCIDQSSKLLGKSIVVLWLDAACRYRFRAAVPYCQVHGPRGAGAKGPALTATLSGHYAVRSGERANLLINFCIESPYFFTLSDGTEYIGQALTMPVPKSSTVSTTYTLVSFSTCCGLSPNSSGTARIDVTNCAIGVINATLSGGT